MTKLHQPTLDSVSYRPRRASKKWLEGAPEYVLAVYDHPKALDHYTILFGGSLLEPQLLLCRQVYALALSDHPGHPCGISMWLEHDAGERACLGKKIKWLDLPENVRNHVVTRVGNPES